MAAAKSSASGGAGEKSTISMVLFLACILACIGCVYLLIDFQTSLEPKLSGELILGQVDTATSSYPQQDAPVLKFLFEYFGLMSYVLCFMIVYVGYFACFKHTDIWHIDFYKTGLKILGFNCLFLGGAALLSRYSDLFSTGAGGLLGDMLNMFCDFFLPHVVSVFLFALLTFSGITLLCGSSPSRVFERVGAGFFKVLPSRAEQNKNQSRLQKEPDSTQLPLQNSDAPLLDAIENQNITPKVAVSGSIPPTDTTLTGTSSGAAISGFSALDSDMQPERAPINDFFAAAQQATNAVPQGSPEMGASADAATAAATAATADTVGEALPEENSALAFNAAEVASSNALPEQESGTAPYASGYEQEQDLTATRASNSADSVYDEVLRPIDPRNPSTLPPQHEHYAQEQAPYYHERDLEHEALLDGLSAAEQPYASGSGESADTAGAVGYGYEAESAAIEQGHAVEGQNTLEQEREIEQLAAAELATYSTQSNSSAESAGDNFASEREYEQSSREMQMASDPSLAPFANTQIYDPQEVQEPMQSSPLDSAPASALEPMPELSQHQAVQAPPSPEVYSPYAAYQAQAAEAQAAQALQNYASQSTDDSDGANSKDVIASSALEDATANSAESEPEVQGSSTIITKSPVVIEPKDTAVNTTQMAPLASVNGATLDDVTPESQQGNERDDTASASASASDDAAAAGSDDVKTEASEDGSHSYTELTAEAKAEAEVSPYGYGTYAEQFIGRKRYSPNSTESEDESAQEVTDKSTSAVSDSESANTESEDSSVLHTIVQRVDPEVFAAQLAAQKKAREEEERAKAQAELERQEKEKAAAKEDAQKEAETEAEAQKDTVSDSAAALEEQSAADVSESDADEEDEDDDAPIYAGTYASKLKQSKLADKSTDQASQDKEEQNSSSVDDEDDGPQYITPGAPAKDKKHKKHKKQEQGAESEEASSEDEDSSAPRTIIQDTRKEFEEAQERAKAEAEEKARAEEEAKERAKAQAEEKARAEEEARLEAEAKAKAEAEAKERAAKEARRAAEVAEAQAEAEALARAREAEEAQAKASAEAKAAQETAAAETAATTAEAGAAAGAQSEVSEEKVKRESKESAILQELSSLVSELKSVTDSSLSSLHSHESSSAHSTESQKSSEPSSSTNFSGSDAVSSALNTVPAVGAFAAGIASASAVAAPALTSGALGAAGGAVTATSLPERSESDVAIDFTGILKGNAQESASTEINSALSAAADSGSASAGALEQEAALDSNVHTHIQKGSGAPEKMLSHPGVNVHTTITRGPSVESEDNDFLRYAVARNNAHLAGEPISGPVTVNLFSDDLEESKKREQSLYQPQHEYNFGQGQQAGVLEHTHSSFGSDDSDGIDDFVTGATHKSTAPKRTQTFNFAQLAAEKAAAAAAHGAENKGAQSNAAGDTQGTESEENAAFAQNKEAQAQSIFAHTDPAATASESASTSLGDNDNIIAFNKFGSHETRTYEVGDLTSAFIPVPSENSNGISSGALSSFEQGSSSSESAEDPAAAAAAAAPVDSTLSSSSTLAVADKESALSSDASEESSKDAGTTESSAAESVAADSDDAAPDADAEDSAAIYDDDDEAELEEDDEYEYDESEELEDEESDYEHAVATLNQGAVAPGATPAQVLSPASTANQALAGNGAMVGSVMNMYQGLPNGQQMQYMRLPNGQYIPVMANGMMMGMSPAINPMGNMPMQSMPQLMQLPNGQYVPVMTNAQNMMYPQMQPNMGMMPPAASGATPVTAQAAPAPAPVSAAPAPVSAVAAAPAAAGVPSGGVEALPEIADHFGDGLPDSAAAMARELLSEDEDEAALSMRAPAAAPAAAGVGGMSTAGNAFMGAHNSSSSNMPSYMAGVAQGSSVSFDTPHSLSLCSVPRHHYDAWRPELSLLSRSHDHVETSLEELDKTSERINSVLHSFGVKASVADYLTGPVITRFDLDLAPGVKSSAISSIEKELCRNLLVSNVRVVPIIDGSSYVGLEVPNPKRQLITLGDMVTRREFQESKAILPMCLGASVIGEPVVKDLAETPHLLVAGTTGSGKSAGLNTMLISLLLKRSPEELRLILVDPKQLEFSIYKDLPHLITPVITDVAEKTPIALNWCVEEMERRFKLMSLLGVRKLSEYNALIRSKQAQGQSIPDPLWTSDMGPVAQSLKVLPWIVVVVEEFADLMAQSGRKKDKENTPESLIARLSAKSRAAGIHLVLVTQTPRSEVVTGMIKANFPSRIAFTVQSRLDSTIVLDDKGAESLLGNGDMLYKFTGDSSPTRAHGAFTSNDDVKAVVDAWRAKAGVTEYLEDVIAVPEEVTDPKGEEKTKELDVKFDQAVEVVRSYMETFNKPPTVSDLQTELGVGYPRAKKIHKQLLLEGIIDL